MLKLRTRLQKGDGLEITRCILSDQDAKDCLPTIVIPIDSWEKESKRKFAEDKLGEVKKWLKEDRTSRPSSSIATSLFSLLEQYENRQGSVIAVISDGLENSNLTKLDFYTDSRLLKKDNEKWAELIKQLQTVKSAPKLKLTKIYWVSPPRPVGDSVRVRNALDLWEQLFVTSSGLSEKDIRTEY